MMAILALEGVAETMNNAKKKKLKNLVRPTFAMHDNVQFSSYIFAIFSYNSIAQFVMQRMRHSEHNFITIGT